MMSILPLKRTKYIAGMLSLMVMLSPSVTLPIVPSQAPQKSSNTQAKKTVKPSSTKKKKQTFSYFTFIKNQLYSLMIFLGALTHFNAGRSHHSEDDEITDELPQEKKEKKHKQKKVGFVQDNYQPTTEQGQAAFQRVQAQRQQDQARIRSALKKSGADSRPAQTTTAQGMCEICCEEGRELKQACHSRVCHSCLNKLFTERIKTRHTGRTKEYYAACPVCAAELPRTLL